MKRIFSSLVIVGFLFGCGTFAGKPVRPAGCEQSVLYDKIPNLKEVDLLLKIGVIEVVKKKPQLKTSILNGLNELDRLLSSPVPPTYVDLLAVVTKDIAWINDQAGIEILILSEYAGVFSQPIQIFPCDISLLREHIKKQIFYIDMVK